MNFQTRSNEVSEIKYLKGQKTAPTYNTKINEVNKMNLGKSKCSFPLVKKSSVDNAFLKSINGDRKFKKVLSK